MNTEFLKELGLSDEAVSAIMEKHEEGLALEYQRGLDEQASALDALKTEKLIDAHLLQVNAKNPDILKKLINAEAISLENGEITGLAEQIDALRQENPFLFEDDAPSPKFTVKPKASDGITKASFDKMSYMDRVKLYSKNPSLYKKLQG